MYKMVNVETRDTSADMLTFDGRVFDEQTLNACCEERLSSTEPSIPPTSSLLSALEGVRAHAMGDEAVVDWQDRPTEELVRYILRKLHRPLGVSLLNVEALVDRVIETHGEEMGDSMREIREAFISLRDAILAHLLNEEDILFPWILSGHDRSNVKAVIYTMRQQHREITAKIKTVVGKTSRLLFKAHICAGQQALYAILKELEATLSDHIYMENEELYPRVLRE